MYLKSKRWIDLVSKRLCLLWSRPSHQDWIHVTDVVARYSLFSPEHVDTLMLAMLGRGQDIAYLGALGDNAYSPTFVDVVDSETIVAGFSEARLKSTPPAHVIFVAMVFKYACINLHPTIFNARIPQLFAGVVERAWVQFKKVAQLNDRQLGNLSTFIEHIVQITLYGFISSQEHYSDHYVELFRQETGPTQTLFLWLLPARPFSTFLDGLSYCQHFHQIGI